jgi:hypothetical protein
MAFKQLRKFEATSKIARTQRQPDSAPSSATTRATQSAHSSTRHAHQRAIVVMAFKQLSQSNEQCSPHTAATRQRISTLTKDNASNGDSKLRKASNGDSTQYKR